MRLLNIRLENFRSYASALLRPGSELTVLYGENGSGKTNVLESVYFLSTTRGFRVGKDGDLVRWDAKECRVEGEVQRTERICRIELHFGPGLRKEAKVDGATVTRTADVIGLLHVVDFSSRDLSLIRGEPARRREFMDVELAQQSKGYAMNLARYKRSLAHRNALLADSARTGRVTTELSAWDEQLVTYGEALIHARAKWIREVVPVAAEMHRMLSGCSEPLECEYRPDVEPGQFAEVLERQKREDIEKGTTSRGPHRDDIEVSVCGHSARVFASQGQQRTAALALKMAQAVVAEKRQGEMPVLLLDDVMSDLDENRRNRLLELCFSGAQIIMTCTEPLQLASRILREAKLVKVEESRLLET